MANAVRTSVKSTECMIDTPKGRVCDQNKMISLFKRRVKNSGIMRIVLDRRYFKKRSQINREKKMIGRIRHLKRVNAEKRKWGEKI